MNKISAIIIAKNEEQLIQKCLESVRFCDEIIVVDNSSTDKTAEIARKHNAEVYVITANDFSKLRNEGLKKAKGEWILYVDADERITSELAKEIQNTVRSHNTKAAYRLKRKNFYYGNHEWPHIEHILRLFNKKYLKEWYGQLHESPKVEGEVGELNGLLLHYSHRNLSEMVKKTIEWSKIEAELRFKAGHPKMALWRFPRVMFGAFYDSYFRQEGWKAGTIGIIESMYQAFSIFITYARLWELQNKA